jgi:hypothetical protein
MGSFYMENCNHTLTIDNMQKIKVLDAKEVLAFSSKEIKIKLSDKTILVVGGENLKITCFDDKNGSFIAVGKILSTRYKQGVTSAIKKVFG